MGDFVVSRSDTNSYKMIVINTVTGDTISVPNNRAIFNTGPNYSNTPLPSDDAILGIVRVQQSIDTTDANTCEYIIDFRLSKNPSNLLDDTSKYQIAANFKHNKNMQLIDRGRLIDSMTG